MTAGTQIESLVEKKKEIYDKAANLLAEAIIERTNTSTVNMNTKKDILNIIKGFNTDEQVEVLSTALIIIAMNGRFNTAPSNKTFKKKSGKNGGSILHGLTSNEFDDFGSDFDF